MQAAQKRCPEWGQAQKTVKTAPFIELLPPAHCVWGFHTQVYAALPPILVVCSSLSLCVSPFLYLPASALLEFLVLSGAAGAAWL